MNTLNQLGAACKQASRQIMNATSNQKNELLKAIAEQLKQDIPAILAANQKDVEQGKTSGMNAGLIDRTNAADYRRHTAGCRFKGPRWRNQQYAYD